MDMSHINQQRIAGNNSQTVKTVQHQQRFPGANLTQLQGERMTNNGGDNDFNIDSCIKNQHRQIYQ